MNICYFATLEPTSLFKGSNLNISVMSEFSSWGKVEPLVEPPKPVKKAIQKKVMARLSMARFIGSIVDLYVGKAGETLVGIAETFNDTDIEDTDR